MFAGIFDEVVVFSIDMRVRFRDITVREGMLLRRGDRWSEWSPFLEYPEPEAAGWLKAALEADEPPIRRERIPVNVTVPVVSPRRAADLVRSSGCRTAKVKVAEPGQTLADDLARVEAVRDALGPGGRVRVDANGAWSVDAALAALRQLGRGGLEYAEQPCRTVEELRELRLALARRGIEVPIAADESIRRAGDPQRVVEREAADIAVLKVQPLGGVRACLRLAEQLGLPVVVSSALETSVGIRAGVALAAALPDLPHDCGLNTVGLLVEDVAVDPLVAVGGVLPVRDVVLRPASDWQRLGDRDHWRARLADATTDVAATRD